MASSNEWLKRVEAWTASGQSAAEFYSGRGFSAVRLQWWAWHFRRKGAAPAEKRGVQFARVVRSEERGQTKVTPGVVVHVGAARIEVGAGADPAAVAAVLGALLTNRAGAEK